MSPSEQLLILKKNHDYSPPHEFKTGSRPREILSEPDTLIYLYQIVINSSMKNRRGIFPGDFYFCSLERIRSTTDLKVKMRPGRSAGISHRTDPFAPLDRLADPNRHAA